MTAPSDTPTRPRTVLYGHLRASRDGLSRPLDAALRVAAAAAPTPHRPPQRRADTTSEDQVTPKLLLTVEEAADQLGIGRTLAYTLVKSGDIESVQIGRLRRVPPDSLDRFLARLRAAEQSGHVAVA